MKHPIHHIQFKRPTIFIVVICILVWVSGCQEPEPFPTTPNISFKNLKFVKTQENNTLDSLVLEFDFEDGDGDLGLSEELLPPYHAVDYIMDNNANPVTLNGDHPTPFFKFTPADATPLERNTPPYFGSVELFSETDNRPTYSCQDYDTISFTNLDTLFVVRNEFRNNLYVKFFWNINGEGFQELDFEYLTSPFGCGENFNGRFPIWDESNIGTSLQGSIKYSMISSGFEITLRNTPFKLQFYIYDRATNKSNVIETPVYTLEEITVLQ